MQFKGLEEILEELYSLVGPGAQICILKPAGYDDWCVSVGHNNNTSYSPVVAARLQLEKEKARVR